MGSIKNELFFGVFYTAISKYSGITVSLVVTVVLSRILTPDDFGIVAIATIITTFFGLFTNIGLSPAIIQRKDLDENDYSNIFSFTIWLGIFLSVSFYFSSWAIGAYFEKELLIPICQLLSVNLLFSTFSILPNTLFYKNKRFKFLAIRSLVIQIITGLIAICVALLGGGLYALVVNPILSSMFLFIIAIKVYPQKLTATLGIDTLKKVFSYSAYQFLFNVINYFSMNLDKLLIGKLMNMQLLGYYEKSYRLMMLPLQNLSYVITPVMHPVLSDYQNNLTKLAQSYEQIVKLIAFIGFPLTVLLYFSANELILLLFGNQWAASVPVFRILVFSVGIQMIMSTSGTIYQAANDTRSLFICGLFSAVTNVTGLLISIFIFKTIEAIACSICITFTINFVQCYIWMYKVTFKRSMKTLIKLLVSPVVLSLLVFIGLFGLTSVLESSNMFISLLTKSLLTFLLSCFYVQIMKEYDIREFTNLRLKSD